MRQHRRRLERLEQDTPPRPDHAGQSPSFMRIIMQDPAAMRLAGELSDAMDAAGVSTFPDVMANSTLREQAGQLALHLARHIDADA